MILFLEGNIRGGVSFINQRHCLTEAAAAVAAVAALEDGAAAAAAAASTARVRPTSAKEVKKKRRERGENVQILYADANNL